jgi:uncharacterized protein (TIGR02300 family)
MSTKAARGTKRTCQSCEARFYDLNRNPIICPMCGATFVKDTRESRRAAEHAEEADELPIAAMARAGAGAGAIAGATASSEDMPEIIAEDEVPEIETEDAEIETDDEEDTFLEQEEEDGDDVGKFIDSPIEGGDEEA